MNKPISFNVIRQALGHMGLPTPTMRVLSVYTLPDGTSTAEYLLTWTIPQLERHQNPKNAAFAFVDYEAFRNEVQQSFAEDCTVVDQDVHGIPGMYQIMLHVRVTPREVQLELPL